MVSTTDPMPALAYALGPCLKCGARTEVEAETRCLQTQDQTGEWSCPGEFDEHGDSIVPSAESIKMIDDWCDREATRQGW